MKSELWILTQNTDKPGSGLFGAAKWRRHIERGPRVLLHFLQYCIPRDILRIQGTKEHNLKIRRFDQKFLAVLTAGNFTLAAELGV